MASAKQIAANRRNAARSTGPKTLAGKARSRQNALRHGLTAQTVIAPLEDPDDYKRFEATIAAGFSSSAALNRELVSRLASLLWRLRRATAIESALMEIQAEILSDRRRAPKNAPPPHTGLGMIYGVLNWPHTVRLGSEQPESESTCQLAEKSNGLTVPMSRTDLARCFLRLNNLDNGILDRLNRYESMLWRQVLQLMLLLNSNLRFSFQRPASASQSRRNQPHTN